jgi:hypothetical protein
MKTNRKPKGIGFFTWGPQWGYRFPVQFVHGGDEYYRRTIGIITWAGSVFLAYPCKRCRSTPCDLCAEPDHIALECPYDDWDYDENEVISDAPLPTD